MSFIPSKKSFLGVLFIFAMLSVFSAERNVIFSCSMAKDKTLTRDDIMSLFKEKSLKYLRSATQYLCDFTVYSTEDKQNYAWAVAVVQDKFKDGSIYEVWFSFSNGVFVLKAGDNSFTSLALGGENDDDTFSSQPINATTSKNINKDLEDCLKLSIEARIQNGLSFNFENEDECSMNYYKFD